MADKFTFAQYIQKFQDWFTVDEPVKRLIDILGWYANGCSEFEDVRDKDYIFKDQSKLYLEKGILLIGNVGTGKTSLLKMLQKYFSYISGGDNQHNFRISSIPDMADKFSVTGRESFSKYKNFNWLMDELCFINEKTGLPDREYAINYGDKILIGEKVIYDRYVSFCDHGLKTHFTTNANLKQIRDIYGERVHSRLIEMCNVLVYTGKDRRINARPHIWAKPVEKKSYVDEEKNQWEPTVNDDESFINMCFSNYQRNKRADMMSPHEYEILLRYAQLPFISLEWPDQRISSVVGYYDSLIKDGVTKIKLSK